MSKLSFVNSSKGKEKAVFEGYIYSKNILQQAMSQVPVVVAPASKWLSASLCTSHAAKSSLR